jgi:lysophosphatidate acyltransferase
MGVSYRIVGAEHLSRDRAAVVICNHQSMLDFLGMCFLWPVAGKLAAVAKREILFVWPFGVIAWLSGTVFINRKRPGESQETVNNMEDKIKKEKVNCQTIL